MKPKKTIDKGDNERKRKDNQKNEVIKRKGKKKQRSAPGPLGDFCEQQLADFLLYFLFLFLSLPFLLITSFF